MNGELFGEEVEPAQAQAALPRPTRERWQPLRSGILNIFKYSAEEFWFEDGRLLLRGNNGAGKSRILALQLPFLLDGEMAPHRVEPDGDPAKRMEWNLLMNRHEHRLGYTWIEFGRRDAAGAEHYVTLGCGMHAHKGAGLPPNARWFFVTRQRVGATLRLMAENRVPLGRERLEAALGEEGAVYRSARDYRAAVDAVLFGLGARYGPLIDLLLQLRKPQIMRDFKADDLSRLLSEALPPLSPRLIDSVSVSFRSLESDRQQLTDLRETSRSVATFLQSYRHYMRVAVRRRAADVRTSHSRYEGAQREIKRLADEREKQADLLQAEEGEEYRLGNELATTRATERELLGSPEMKSAEDLHRADELRSERTRLAAGEETRAEQDREKHAEAIRELREAAEAVSGRMDAADRRRTALQEAWREAVLTPPAPEQESKLAAAMQERSRGIALLRGKNDAVGAAGERRGREEVRFDAVREEVARGEEAATVARTACEAELTALAADTYRWERSLEVLALPALEVEDWHALFAEWLPVAQTLSPLEARMDAASRAATQRIDAGRSQCERALTERAAERDELTAEIEELLAGRQPEPSVPPTRAPGVRLEQPGAPLWKLCGFREEVSAADRAGYEAALEAAGLLDAWVTPEGTLVDPAAQDTYFIAAHGRTDAGLNRILRAEGGMTDIVAGILSQIGSKDDEGETWVSSDGGWQHGRLRGAWLKPVAEYLGHAAREEKRLSRLAELEAGRATVEEAIQNLEEEQRRLEEQDARLTEERRRAPPLAPARSAAQRLEGTESAAADARVRLEAVDQSLAKARSAEETARAERDRDADDLGLADWKEPEVLRRLEERLGEVRVRATAFWPAREAWRHAQAALEKSNSREHDAREAVAVSDGRAQEARRRAAEAEASFAILQATVGATVEQVVHRLHETRAALQRLDEEERAARARVSNARVALARLEAQETAAVASRRDHEEARAAAIRRLQTFVEKHLLEEASEDLQPASAELAATSAVELARAIEQRLTEIAADDDAWKRAQSGIQQQFGELTDQLGMRGYHPQAELVDEGVFAITCAFQGQTQTTVALGHLLSSEIASREEMLDAREREVIENHLIGEIATELQTLIRAGEDWKQAANNELDRQPASSGIKLRFTWEVDPDATDDLVAARALLLKTTAAWSPAERDGIGRFLQGRIQAERAADPSAPWHEHLRRALDYRLWHRFGILRFQDGQWKKLTKQTYGTGSGGEKALTLTLPQFAAAAAHYRSAMPHAPRLILLDEVFIGIDAPTRARLMALLTNFDLDFVMTSEREWGCYRTVPALSICQLASRPDSTAVHVTRWLWNGRARSMHPHGDLT